MPRPKDSKVWNEDLILALQAREQMARQNNKRSHLVWKEGRQQIESVRNDIYTFKNGRIVNLPNKLKTTVDNVCRCIIAGTEPILPAGYVPPNMRPQNGENPYINDPYLKSIKKRGGAFAILMAFHTASYDDQVLTKDEICRLAQPYCDTEMEANYMAGRARGAWSSIKTLENHDLIMVQKRQIQYNGNAGGFRSMGCNSYVLTANGKLFIQALFVRNPDLQNHIQSNNEHNNMTHRPGVMPSNHHNRLDGIDFLDDPNGNLHEWQEDYDPFTVPSTGTLSSSLQLPMKTSPSRSFSAFTGSTGHVLDESPSAKRQLQFMAPNEAARLAALERYAIHESIHMSRPHGNNNKARLPSKHSTPTKKSITSTNKITPSSSMLPSISISQPPPPQRLKPPPVIDLDDEDDYIAENDDRKIPANPYHRTTSLWQSQQGKSTTTAAAVAHLPVVLDIDSDSDDDILLQSPFSSKTKSLPKKNVPTACDLTKARPAVQIYDENDFDDDDDNYIQIESQSSDVQIIEPDDVAMSKIYPKIDSSANFVSNSSLQLTIYIDNRERNRNATPRTLRMELTRLVSSETHNGGSLLSIVWPETVPRPIVEERQIANGDFSFHRMISQSSSSLSLPVSQERSATISIPVLVERKRIGDIVQRSSKKDHWYQLQRMQDEAIGRIIDYQDKPNGICIMLLEGDPRTTRQYVPYGSQNVDTTSPFVHTIDDEETLYRYMFRAVLNDQAQTTRFVQTSDEQGSLRMVGVLGLMSISNDRLSQVKQNMRNINTKAERVCIIKRLQNGGIPWTLVTRITDEIRSVEQLDMLYSSLHELSCRELMLVPLISDLCSTDDLSSSASAWSKAIYYSWNSKLSDPTTAQKDFKELSPIVDDHALLLEKLHNGLCAERAVDEVLGSMQLKIEKEFDRVVCIDLPKESADCFPVSPSNATTFYRLHIVDKPQKIPSIVMRTYAGPYYSPRFIIFSLEGNDIVRRIQSAIKESVRGQDMDYVAMSKTLAEKLYRDFCVVTAKDDTLVLLIRALGLALDNAAKKCEYRSEIRIIAEMIQAELMIEHKTVVVHAIRLNGGDREMIIRQMALACYHYQLLKYKSKTVVS